MLFAGDVLVPDIGAVFDRGGELDPDGEPDLGFEVFDKPELAG